MCICIVNKKMQSFDDRTLERVRKNYYTKIWGTKCHVYKNFSAGTVSVPDHANHSKSFVSQYERTALYRRSRNTAARLQNRN